MIRPRVAVVLLTSLGLAACSTGASTTGSGTGGASSTLPASPGAGKPTGSSPVPGGSPTSPATFPTDAGPPFLAPGTTASAPAAGSGRGLSVTDLRTADNTGFDRVVFELGGTGTVGWRVRYDADPRRQGSGEPVRLGTPATLSVMLDGVAYPTDSGVPEYSGPRRLSPNLSAVRAVQLGGVFEGSVDAFVGVAANRPFRVFRLDNPQRVVLDVQR